jgi:hypothetical protein
MELPPQKQLFRLASAILASLDQHRQQLANVDLPDQTWTQAKQLTRQLRLAQVRGWQSAYRRRQCELRIQLDRLRNELYERQGQLLQPVTVSASLGDLVQDLTALHREFDSVEWDLRAGTLAVTTDPITLDDQYLGAFSIELEWRRLQAGSPYRVSALDPQPAGRDGSVTHPHVQDELLCEGEGKPALRAALAGGRLYDFFSLIANILTTYNPASAYVPLTDWNGCTCSGCGGIYGDDDCFSCCRCQVTVCDDCYVCCGVCGDPHCSDCTESCELCHESACQPCLETCTACLEQVCTNCLTDTNNKCENCHDQERESATTTIINMA